MKDETIKRYRVPIITVLLILYFSPLIVAIVTDNIIAWSIFCFVSIIHIGIVILGEYIQHSFKKSEVLVDYVIDDYKKLLYPPNYQNLELDAAEEKYNGLLEPISVKVSYRKILKTELSSVLIYAFATLIFGIMLTVTYSFFTEFERRPLHILLGVFDSLAKGMLFDLFESYGLGIATYEKNTYFLKTIDFLVRTFASLIVITKAIKLFHGLRAGFRYKRVMSDTVSKYEFMVDLYRRLEQWSRTVPAFLGGYPNLREKLDENLMEYLWQSDGGPEGTTFMSNYSRLKHREARGYLEDNLLNIPYDYRSLSDNAQEYFEKTADDE